MTQDRTDARGEAARGEALSVLRGIWTAQEQNTADLDAAPSTTRVCKNMENVGFGGIAGVGADGESTAGPVGEDLRTAWRTKLEREGKLAPDATSLRELVLGDSVLGDPAPRDSAPGE